jgi:hypothetical protein
MSRAIETPNAAGEGRSKTAHPTPSTLNSQRCKPRSRWLGTRVRSRARKHTHTHTHARTHTPQAKVATAGEVSATQSEKVAQLSRALEAATAQVLALSQTISSPQNEETRSQRCTGLTKRPATLDREAIGRGLDSRWRVPCVSGSVKRFASVAM